jgi:D-3-phosphoglycerate dehydrogenase / 2-oxoglutarate reductase
VTSFRVVLTDFTDPHQHIETDVFNRSGLDINLVRAEPGTDHDLAALAPQADALLVQFAQVRKDVIDSLRNCRVISRYGIGVDMIDIEAAAERGIPVANVPDFCIDEVSTQTIGFLIDLNRHTRELSEYVRTGGWGHRPVPCAAPRRVAGQVLGVVGLGAIGREVARKAIALGLAVLAYDPFLDSAPTGVTLVDLDTLLQRSDYVTLHCPLVPQTRGLIGAAAFAQMKPTAYLLNLSRGPVVDQDALFAALTDGSIAGAAVDVLTTEPPAIDDPLLSLPNLIVTPHSSSWSAESSDQLRHDAAENIVEALSGRLPRSIVNRSLLRL